MFNADNIITFLTESFDQALVYFSDVDTYIQLGCIVFVYVVAFVTSFQVKKRFKWVSTAPEDISHPIRKLIYGIDKLLYPLIAIIILKFGSELLEAMSIASWAIKIALGVAMLLFLNQLIERFVFNRVLAKLFKWIALPILFLSLIGLLTPITEILDSIKIEAGNVSVSAYGLARVLIFGVFLFWFGRASNQFGQDIIRKQETLDTPTKEVIAKLFEFVLFAVVILILLNIMGINLTALTVFGGAIGVGIGFGLQSIASNFISGIIILLDRSVTVDDFIEFEDGSKGYVRECKMRYATMETFDGRFIMVPNEKFINDKFINWSHKDLKQRFRVDFSVAYKTDIRALCDIIRKVVSTHPQVISGDDVPAEQKPDCEIDSFGDSGINMFVEFWMDGVDDGKNRVGGDLMLMIFETLREHNIEIPFPQSEVRVLNPNELSPSKG